MFLERLAAEDLGEDVSCVLVRCNVFHLDHAGAAKLAHLEHISIDVARMLSGCKAMAQVVCPFVVGFDTYRIGALVAYEFE